MWSRACFFCRVSRPNFCKEWAGAVFVSHGKWAACNAAEQATFGCSFELTCWVQPGAARLPCWMKEKHRRWFQGLSLLDPVFLLDALTNLMYCFHTHKHLYFMYVHSHTRTYNMETFISAYTHVYVYCMYATCAHMYIYLIINSYIYICTHTHAYTYIYM